MPPGIANLTQLEMLNLFNNHIEELPVSLSSMPKLRILNIGQVDISFYIKTPHLHVLFCLTHIHHSKYIFCRLHVVMVALILNLTYLKSVLKGRTLSVFC